MASESSIEASDEPYDVYISYPAEDVAWAMRLAVDLRNRGLAVSMERGTRAGQSWEEALDEAVNPDALLVVLWSPAVRSPMLGDIAAFERALAESGPDPRVITVLLGDRELLDQLPDTLAAEESLIVGEEVYAAGPNAESVDWDHAVEEIAHAVRTRRPPRAKRHPAASQEDFPEFSETARTALTDAAEMLEGLDDDPARVRTAALLGALRASAMSGMAPTTGDVVRLVQERQGDRRSVRQALTAAAVAAGLQPPSGIQPSPMSIDELMSLPTRELVLAAIRTQERTGGSGVHLRHVLATGVSTEVADEALLELGVTLPDLRARWRQSIARTRPDESQAWDELLLEPPSGERHATDPPSARVHADRWTVEDRLDYALYAKAISEFIRHPDAKPPMVISVQGPWGQGKTSLMRMVQSDLDPGHPDLRPPPRATPDSAAEPPSELTFGELRKSLSGKGTVPKAKPTGIRTVWFNAWKYQSSEQVWAGLAHAILAQLPARLERKDCELFWLRLQLRRIDPSAVRSDIHKAVLEKFIPWLAGLAMLAVGVSLLAASGGAPDAEVAGGGVLAAAGLAGGVWIKATRDVLNRSLEGAYLRYVRQPDYSSKLGYLHLVESDMAHALDLLTPDDKPAVIFIDDLDRCSPGKIAEVIEAVNLFLAGDYPNCVFVIGVDAEVVAASMEVVHADIIEKLGDRRGELGWRFMDKFVQLPFVMPRLHRDQRLAYLRGLFSTPEDEEVDELVAEADQLDAEAEKLKSEDLNDTGSVEDFARRVGELAPKLAAVAPERARDLGEKVVSAGASAFSDNDPEVIEALEKQMQHLSDNPRTIKRAVNLYRFHRFAAFARQASTLPLEVATPEQIGRWIVVIIRWPQFVRWLQVQREQGASDGKDPAARVIAHAAEADSQQEFQEALKADGIDASWAEEAELWEFLHAETPAELTLDLAGPRGLW